ncbi:MAG: hypothetical protein MZV63_63565 [Marinilabiliales bacterium]|nr:hypothetical protein [Marinilabiliales bacterium]
MALNRSADAIQVYEKVLSISPDDYLSFIRLGKLNEDSGNIQKAREIWLKASRIDPSQPDAYEYLSESYLKEGKDKLQSYYYARLLYDPPAMIARQMWRTSSHQSGETSGQHTNSTSERDSAWIRRIGWLKRAIGRCLQRADGLQRPERSAR